MNDKIDQQRPKLAPSDSFSVKQAKQLFERKFGGKFPPVESKLAPEAPKKPPRTFDHDVYMASKIVNKGSRLVVCRPIPAPRPGKGVARNTKSQRPNKPPPPPPNDEIQRNSVEQKSPTIARDENRPLVVNSNGANQPISDEISTRRPPIKEEKLEKRTMIGLSSGYRHVYACLEPPDGVGIESNNNNSPIRPGNGKPKNDELLCRNRMTRSLILDEKSSAKYERIYDQPLTRTASVELKRKTEPKMGQKNGVISTQEKLYYASNAVPVPPARHKKAGKEPGLTVALDDDDSLQQCGAKELQLGPIGLARSAKFRNSGKAAKAAIKQRTDNLSTALVSVKQKIETQLSFDREKSTNPNHQKADNHQSTSSDNRFFNFVDRKTSGGGARIAQRENARQKMKSSAGVEPGASSDSEESSISSPKTPDSVAMETERRATRARVVRQKTMGGYEAGEAAFRRRKRPQLFEVAAWIKLKPIGDLPEAEQEVVRLMLNSPSINSDSPKRVNSCKFVPVIAQTFPADSRGESPLLASLPYLCYPDFSQIVPITRDTGDYEDQEFVVTLTDAEGARKFAYCRRFLTEKSEPGINGCLPEVFCLVSPVQAASLYMNLAEEATNVIKETPQLLVQFLEYVFCRPLPDSNGEKIKLTVPKGLALGRTLVLENRGTPFGRLDCASILARIGLEKSLAIFAALLSEKRVLIAGDTVPTVSKTVQSFAALLYPFEWPHTLIPVVPDSHVHLCFSPTPYLIGILRGNLNELKDLVVGSKYPGDDLEEFILIIDIDYGIIKDVDYSSADRAKGRDPIERCLPPRVAKQLKQNLEDALKVCDDEKVSESFLLAFARLVGHYRDFVVTQQDEKPVFQKENFIQTRQSKTLRSFLKWFAETGMFQVWIKGKLKHEPSGVSFGNSVGENKTGFDGKNGGNEDEFEEKLELLSKGGDGVGQIKQWLKGLL